MTITWTRDNYAAAHVRPGALGTVSAASAAVSPQTADAHSQQRELAGSLLVDLFNYLDDNAQQHRTLVGSIAILRDAVAQYRADVAPDPLTGARAVYDAIQAARQLDPSIPPA